MRRACRIARLTGLCFPDVPILASKQGVEAPVATAPRGHVQVEKTKQNGRNALVLNRRHAIWCVKLPVGNRHHARKDKCDGPRSKAKHDRAPAKELKEPTDSRLGHQGRGTGLFRNAAKPAKQDQATKQATLLKASAAPGREADSAVA